MLSVAIIGRPNVGKSTLFNRLVGKKLAIVHDMPGVTRDRKMAPAKFRDLELQLIDTAGYEYSTTDNMESRMWRQTQMAINDADLCLFLYDARAGVQPYDEQFADLVRRTHKPVILLANKCEGKQQENGVGEAYKLGLGDPIIFSAEKGSYMSFDVITSEISKNLLSVIAFFTAFLFVDNALKEDCLVLASSRRTPSRLVPAVI